MTDDARLALLPEGLHDELPPEAARHAAVVNALLDCFEAYGYRRVDPPLIEFEESLLAGPGAAHAQNTFRVMDPASHRMMGLRADMTLQIARIAGARLSGSPRPLRLSYAGEVLRVKGGQLRTERQFGQAGVELIGSAAIEADIEALTLAADALERAGVKGLSIDLALPRLVPVLCGELGLEDDKAREVRSALDEKDFAHLARLGDGLGGLLKGLLDSAGPADQALSKLGRLKLPKGAAAMIARLGDLVGRLKSDAPQLVLTVDPGEYRGFEYQTGLGFTLFARGVRGELGRGGRYETSAGEPAIGFSVYLDSLMRGLPKASEPDRLFLPFETPATIARRCRAEGWRTVRALAPAANIRAEAARLECSHLLDPKTDSVVAVGRKS